MPSGKLVSRSPSFDFFFRRPFVLFPANFSHGSEFFDFGFVVFSFELFHEFPDHARLGGGCAWCSGASTTGQGGHDQGAKQQRYTERSAGTRHMSHFGVGRLTLERCRLMDVQPRDALTAGRERFSNRTLVSAFELPEKSRRHAST